MNLTKQIKDIDLIALVESEGINLTKGACCCPFPFHNDTDPSFRVFQDNHFKCFGCGEYGDALDYVCKRHGLSVKDGLKYLGIDNTGTMAVDVRRWIRQVERKRKAKQAYEKRKADLLYTLAVRIRKVRKLVANIKSTEQMEAAEEVFHQLPYIEHCWVVLFHGDPQQIKEAMAALKDMKIVKRRLLFEPGFNYRQWLRGFENGRVA